jgi:hypothetical protein
MGVESPAGSVSLRRGRRNKSHPKVWLGLPAALRLSLSIRTVLNIVPHLTRWPSAEAYAGRDAERKSERVPACVARRTVRSFWVHPDEER